MSSGKFVKAFYQTGPRGNDLVHVIKVQPETLLLTDGTITNGGVAGPATSNISVKASAGKREIGIVPRRITVEFPEGGEIPDYTGDPLTIPILEPTTFDTWAVKGYSLTYLNTACVVASFSEEKIN